MTTLMLDTKKYYSTTLLEAESIVLNAKKEHGSSVKKHSITKKEKSTKDTYIEYFIVEVAIEYYQAKELIGTN